MALCRDRNNLNHLVKQEQLPGLNDLSSGEPSLRVGTTASQAGDALSSERETPDNRGRYVHSGRQARLRRESQSLGVAVVADAVRLSSGTLRRWEAEGIPVYISKTEQRAWENALGLRRGELLRLAQVVPTMSPQIGARARAEREKCGMSRMAVALRLGVSTQTLGKWESSVSDGAFTQQQINRWESALELESGALGGARAPDRGEAAPPSPDIGRRTARAVIVEVARKAAQRRMSGQNARTAGGASSGERAASMFARRYGVDGADGTNLADIARHFGVTESRVCQILRAMPVDFALTKADRQVFDALRLAARPHLPCAEGDLERALLELTGPNITLRGISSFVSEILGKALFEFERVVTRSGSHYIVRDPAVPIAPVSNGGDSAAVSRMARVMIRGAGAAHMGLIRLQAADKGWDARALADIPDALAACDGFEWLEYGTPDSPPQWFWFGEEGARSNPVVSAARRVLCTADHGVTLSTLVSAVERVRVFRSGRQAFGGIASVLPPLHIAEEQLRRLSFVRWSDGHLPRGVPRSRLVPEQELWELELPIFESLVRHGGAAARNEIAADLRDAGITGGSVERSLQVLYYSPVFALMSRGVFRLAARDPDTASLLRAIGNAQGA